MKARIKKEVFVANCNVRTPRGNIAHKDRKLCQGLVLDVEKIFVSTGLATHGSKCVRLRDVKGYTYDVFVEFVEFITGT